MKKWFVLLTSILFIGMMSVTFAVAEVEGDVYEVNPAGWPDKHWAYMSSAEIAQYEQSGWTRYVGTLWYNSDCKYAKEIEELDEILVDSVEEYYNAGYTLQVIYHWVHDGRTLGKHQEQSVYVGRWILSREQAKACCGRGRMLIEELPNNLSEVTPLPEYYSMWLYDGKESAEPQDGDDVSKYAFVRIAYDAYDMAYGEKVLLRNGDVVIFGFDEILELGSVDYEMIHWE